MTFEQWWDKEVGQHLKDEHDLQAARQSLTYKAMKRAYDAGYGYGWDDCEEAYCPRLNQGI